MKSIIKICKYCGGASQKISGSIPLFSTYYQDFTEMLSLFSGVS